MNETTKFAVQFQSNTPGDIFDNGESFNYDFGHLIEEWVGDGEMCVVRNENVEEFLSVLGVYGGSVIEG